MREKWIDMARGKEELFIFALGTMHLQRGQCMAACNQKNFAPAHFSGAIDEQWVRFP